MASAVVCVRGLSGVVLGWLDPVGWLASVRVVSERQRIVVMPAAGVVVVLVATVVGLLLGSDVVSDEVARAKVPTMGVVLRDPLAGFWRGIGAPGAGVILVALVVGSDAIGLASDESAGDVPRRGFVMVASYRFDEYGTITDGDGWSYTYESDLYGGCAHVRAPRLVAWSLGIRAEGEEEKFCS